MGGKTNPIRIEPDSKESRVEMILAAQGPEPLRGESSERFRFRGGETPMKDVRLESPPPDTKMRSVDFNGKSGACRDAVIAEVIAVSCL